MLSEIIPPLKGGEYVQGPELPMPLSSHTVVSLNSTFSMFIGGNLDGLTYYFDHSNQKWYGGPSLIIPRFFHATGLVTDTGQSFSEPFFKNDSNSPIFNFFGYTKFCAESEVILSVLILNELHALKKIDLYSHKRETCNCKWRIWWTVLL